MIYYKSQKYKYKKAILIDIEKAYDSVKRIKLKEIIINKFNNIESDLLTTIIEIYESLIMIINGCEINTVKGLPKGSALLPLLFNLYINDALNNLNQMENISAQAYADDLILQSSDTQTLQKGYEKTIEIYNDLDLHININKCEPTSDIKEDVIINLNQNIEIKAKEEAKYLGQIINNEGIPTEEINTVQFVRSMNILSRTGELTKMQK